MLCRQLDKRELSAEPDPARTGCVQARMTHSEKKKRRAGLGEESLWSSKRQKKTLSCADTESVRMGRECIERLKIAVIQFIFK